METYVPSDRPTFDMVMPDAYASSLETIAPNITGLVADTQAPGESWVDSLARLLPVIATTYQQKQLLDVQVDRARQGLAPLDASHYAPGVNIGLSKDTKQMLMWGGIGVVALVLFMSRR